MSGQVVERDDRFARLNPAQPLGARMAEIHRQIERDAPCIHRVAMALFDEQTGTLRTFVHSSGGLDPLPCYEAHLSQAPSLCSLIETGRGRVVNDLSVFAAGDHAHTRRLHDQGYGSSYTLPLFWNGTFEAFVFFNSFCTQCFTPKVLDLLDLYGHLIAGQILLDRAAVRALLAAVRTLTEVVHARDSETGLHLERMSHFSRLIAVELARDGAWRLDDEAIDHIFLFAPLHDLGKIAVPDRVLQKPGRLEADELREMQRHTLRGREILDHILSNFGLESLPFVDVLRQVAEYHHECLDGSGYPWGLKKADIPIAARIIAVADIFDALTTHRVYKAAWSNEQAYTYLRGLAGTKLDADCVEALVRNDGPICAIQATFAEALGAEAEG